MYMGNLHMHENFIDRQHWVYMSFGQRRKGEQVGH